MTGLDVFKPGQARKRQIQLIRVEDLQDDDVVLLSPQAS